jgi:hypothetical protein
MSFSRMKIEFARSGCAAGMIVVIVSNLGHR